jgi:hypothetical protein
MRSAAAIAALALIACSGISPAAEREAKARDEFIRRLAEREGIPDAWTLLSRHDVIFEDGFSYMTFEDPNAHELEWYEVCTGCRPIRGRPVKWMNRRAHFRLRGDADMRLEIEGRVLTRTIFTRPRVEVMVEGLELGSFVVGEDGRFHVDAIVPRSALDGWTDAYVTISSVSEPWREPADLRAATIERLHWNPAGAPATR